MHVRFSNRAVRVKRFQNIHERGIDVARGLVLLFGIGTRALVWAFLVKKFMQSGASFFFVSFFVRSENLFPRPGPGFERDGTA
jgi:hypothetical protein